MINVLYATVAQRVCVNVMILLDVLLSSHAEPCHDATSLTYLSSLSQSGLNLPFATLPPPELSHHLYAGTR